MEFESAEEFDIEYDTEETQIKTNPDEQLPLQVVSSEDGCFVFDSNGAEVFYTYIEDWKNDPKLSIIVMAQSLRTAYEKPIEALRYAVQYEPMLLFYDANYPNDDVPCLSNYEDRFFENRELPPLGDHNEIDPTNSPFTVETDDNYTDDYPSVVEIIDDNGTTIKAWNIQVGNDGEENVKQGAEVAWNIRLAYERPWELRS